MKKKIWRLAGIAVLLMIAVAGFTYWYGFMRKEKPIEKMKADFVISADSLFAAFSVSEKAIFDFLLAAK